MQLDADLQLINEEFHAENVTSPQLDLLLADGWRHFGTHFFRYNLGIYEDEIRRVLPLRIRLEDFEFSKSQRRILRRNDDLNVQIGPIDITDKTHDLFERHKRRFKSGVPSSIYDFLSSDAAREPTDGFELSVHSEGKLLAVSFFDVGKTSLSSIYAIFDPEKTSRSLGIFTMLKEIEYAIENGKTFYYHGYAYEGESFYDYKKRFSGLEQFDWSKNWIPLLAA
ncbi:MAG: arginine-tRNA-protein transferase [Chloracidobacterium sp.]|nr:arginine-tRNA-protein transferase [Chloracidobacterium sp.]